MSCENVIGVGCDIIEIERFERMSRDPVAGVTSRLFTKCEIDLIPKNNIAQYFASRFAAKEAVMKALGYGMDHIGFKDIEITKDVNGKPVVTLYAGAEAIANRLGVKKLFLSISHDKHSAIAYVLATGSGLQ